MKNEDKINKDFVHLYLALRRKKENPDLQQLCCRKIIYDNEHDLKILKAMINKWPGIWRIHKTVNKRDCRKAGKLLMHKLLDEPILCTQMESLWKTCLMKPESRAEHNFLLDIDSLNQSLIKDICCILEDQKIINNGIFTTMTKTPNGYHAIIPPFDIRIMEDFKAVTVHRDGYLFIELYENKILQH